MPKFIYTIFIVAFMSCDNTSSSYFFNNEDKSSNVNSCMTAIRHCPSTTIKKRLGLGLLALTSFFHGAGGQINLTPMLETKFSIANNTISSDYSKDGVAALSDGRFVTVWVNGSNSVGLGQLYSFDVIPYGDPFVIGSGSLVQSNIGVVVIPGNKLVTVWNSPPGIKGQIFNEFGNVSSAVFNVTDNGVDPRISFLDNGGFALAYTRNINESVYSADLYVNIFDNNANIVNSDIFVKDMILKIPTLVYYDISTIQNDRFAVVYSNYINQTTILFTKVYNNAGGVVVPEFVVDQKSFAELFNPYITFLSKDFFLITWESVTYKYFQVFDDQIQNISAINNISILAFSTEGLYATTRLSNNDYVIVFLSQNSGQDFVGQRFSFNAFLQGMQFLIKDYAGKIISQSSIDTLVENCFVTTWYEDSIGAKIGDYYGAKYCANNTAEFCQQCGDFPCGKGETCCVEQSTNFECIDGFLCPNSADPEPTQNYDKCPPTSAPTSAPTSSPIPAPTQAPTSSPTPAPTSSPTLAPTPSPTPSPSQAPTKNQTLNPTNNPTSSPIPNPTSPQIFSTQTLQEIKDEGLEALDIIGIIALSSGSLFCCCIFLLIARFFFIKWKIQGNRYTHIPRNL